jgi:hypothetical protein
MLLRSLPAHVHTAVQVSLDIQLAVGITDSQEAAGADQAMAAWLAQPGGVISAINNNPGLTFGPDLLIKWLKTPEIWTNLVRTQLLLHTLVFSRAVGLYRLQKEG